MRKLLVAICLGVVLFLFRHTALAVLCEYEKFVFIITIYNITLIKYLNTQIVIAFKSTRTAPNIPTMDVVSLGPIKIINVIV